MSVEKRKEIAQNQAEKLKSYLKEENKSLRQFADEFYSENVDANASTVELDDHFERFKTSIKRNAEVTTLYLAYYNNKHLNNNTITPCSRDAAFELYSQLCSRVSSAPLPNDVGCDVSALNSVFSLFQFWRDLHSKYGRQSCYFIKHSKPFFDNSIRILTTKWHNELDSSKINKDFRNDLLLLQNATNEYLKKLEQDFGL